MRSIYRTACVTLSLLAAACGGDNGTGPGTGDGNGDGGGIGNTSFTAHATGAIAQDLSGSAYFGDDQGTTSEGFAVALGALDANQQTMGGWVAFYRDQSGRPATGTYVVGNGDETLPADQFYAVAMLKANTENKQLCMGTAGSFKVTSSASERVKGSFDIQLECVPLTEPSAEPVAVTLKGDFDAAKALVPSPVN